MAAIVDIQSTHLPFLLDPHNATYSIREEGHGHLLDEDAASGLGQDMDTPAPASPPILRITTAQPPKNQSLGYVFGRSDSNDLVLAGIQGVSRKHFALRFTPDRQLCIQNLSMYGTWIREGRGDSGSRPVCIAQTRFAPFEFEIVLQEYTFRIQRHDHDDKEGFGREWARYCSEHILEQVPLLAQLNIQAGTSYGGTTIVNAFRQGEYIGRGGAARVYKMIHYETAASYAGKLINPKHFRYQEVVLLGRLTHKHIVKFVAFIYEPEMPILITEFVGGRTLQDEHKDAGRFNTNELKEISQQLLEAVCYMHAQSVIHCDIKPSNIMLHSRAPIHLVLLDFGEAVDIDELRLSYGTPLFTAPEIWSGNHCSKKRDVWSFGMSLLALAFGIPRPRDEQQPSRSRQWLADVYQRLSQPQSSIAGFIYHTLEEDPVVRPSASKCLEHSFITSPVANVPDLQLSGAVFEDDVSNVWPTGDLPTIPFQYVNDNRDLEDAADFGRHDFGRHDFSQPPGPPASRPVYTHQTPSVEPWLTHVAGGGAAGNTLHDSSPSLDDMESMQVLTPHSLPDTATPYSVLRFETPRPESSHPGSPPSTQDICDISTWYIPDHLGARTRKAVSTVASDFRPRRQPKRTLIAEALACRADRLKRLRPRVDGKVAGACKLET